MIRALALCFMFFCGLLACSVRPGWILKLPDRSSAIGADPMAASAIFVADLGGRWVRTVDSRYGVGNPRAHSIGSESIQIEGADLQASRTAYTKLHLYRERIGNARLTRGYQEYGTLTRRGAYVLLTPGRAESFAPVARDVRSPEPLLASELRLPRAGELAWEPSDVGDSLLYYYEPERVEPHPNSRSGRRIPARLTPLAYEAFGRIYEHGIYEGAEFPYDSSSKNFRDAVRIWNTKRNQPHAYVRGS